MHEPTGQEISYSVRYQTIEFLNPDRSLTTDTTFQSLGWNRAMLIYNWVQYRGRIQTPGHEYQRLANFSFERERLISVGLENLA